MGYEDFDIVFRDAHFRFDKKNTEFKDAWKKMSLEELQEDLYNKELMEKASQKDLQERYKRLIDIINDAAMLAVKIRERI